MVNPGIVFLVILIIILTIGIIALLISASISHANDQHNGGGGSTGTNFLPPCSQNINISSLIQIPDSDANCIQRGATGPLFYIGNLDSGQFDYVVAPWGTQPLDVCVGFCSSFTGGHCTGPNYNGQSAQSNFDNCMNQLSSTTCSPPKPIAAKGTIIYYAFSPTCNICDNCG